jgi:RNA polymerase-binding transcription factor DksA
MLAGITNRAVTRMEQMFSEAFILRYRKLLAKGEALLKRL